MNTERIIYTTAGSMILLSLALAHWVDPRWIYLAVFVGANLFQSGITNFCPPSIVLRKLGVPEGGNSCGVR